MNVIAVIVTYNSAKTIEACIGSLQKHDIANITVVDNASTDGTIEKVKNQAVALIQNQENKGFATACNQGATGKANYLFLNPDAALLTDIKPALQLLNENPQTGVIGFHLQDEQGNHEQYNFGGEVTPISLITRHFGNSSPEHCAWVSGAAMLVRRETFTQLNGFDPKFFMYWEDVDFCLRAKQKGWNTEYLPQAQVMHHRGTSFDSNKRKTELYDISADRYFRKHYATSIWASQHILRRTYRLFSRAAY